ncbi:MAG: hypothetical protein KGL39_27505 [Patescibacteria group bacterium]|nr:hypothetical protein [Patescibacteria group bacterium]
MNSQELRAQVMRRLSISKNFSDLTKLEISNVMDEHLAPYMERDRQAVERKQQPYSFDQKSILWLERLVRRKLKL